MSNAVFRRILVLATVVTLVTSAQPAGANGWCRIDPIIRVDGHEASIYIVTEADSTVRSTAYANVLVEYPWQSDGELVWVDPNHGFGYGMGVQVLPALDLGYPAGGIAIRISVLVATSQNGQPLMIEWAPGPAGNPTTSTMVGATNTWIVLNVVLPTG